MRAAFGLIFLALAAWPAAADEPLAAPAYADPADDIAAKLAPHLNAHGKHFVASEAQRFAIGDASESGAKDDVRDACPHPASCLDTSKMSQEELMAAMLLLSEQRSAQRLDNELKQRIQAMQERNATLQRLSAELQNATDDGERARLNAQINKLNADAQMQMIQIQELTNKRNQAHEMLSNLLQKFQKTLDGIVHNMR